MYCRDKDESGPAKYCTTSETAAHYIEDKEIFINGRVCMIDKVITTEGKYPFFSKNIYLVNRRNENYNQDTLDNRLLWLIIFLLFM